MRPADALRRTSDWLVKVVDMERGQRLVGVRGSLWVRTVASKAPMSPGKWSGYHSRTYSLLIFCTLLLSFVLAY